MIISTPHNGTGGQDVVPEESLASELSGKGGGFAFAAQYRVL